MYVVKITMAIVETNHIFVGFNNNKNSAHTYIHIRPHTYTHDSGLRYDAEAEFDPFDRGTKESFKFTGVHKSKPRTHTHTHKRTNAHMRTRACTNTHTHAQA